LSEHAEPSPPNSLDVVRARIFYLASDVEPLSPPAAMLLRAVADAIEENASAEPVSAPMMLNGAAALLNAQMPNGRLLGSHGRAVAQVAGRHIEVVSSRTVHKR